MFFDMRRWGLRIDRHFLLRASLLAGAVGWALPGAAGAASSYATITNVTYEATQPSAPASCSALPSLSGSGSESYTTPSESATWEWTVPATLVAGASAHIKVTDQSFNNGGSDATIGMGTPQEFGTTPSSPSQVTALVPVGAPGSASAEQSYTFDPTRDFVTGEKLYLRIAFGCANFVYEYTGHAATRDCGSARAGLSAKPGPGRPTKRFGPISVYGHVPGLIVVHRARKWVIKGIKVAHLHDRWTLDDCGGIGEIRKVQTANVIAGGRPVATVGDEVFAPATSHGCPSDPLATVGNIVTGDPRIAINGRALAVPGSLVETGPVCGSNVGHVT
jgi:hypothetical protein